MPIYSETYRIDRPPTMIASQLEEGFDRQIDDWSWQARRVLGLYTLVVHLDTDEGLVHRHVRLPWPIRLATLCTLPVSVGVFLADFSETLTMAVLWASAMFVVIGVGHVVPGAIPPMGLDVGVETAGQRLGPAILPPVFAVLLGLVVVLRSAVPTLLADAVTLLLCVLAGTAYWTVRSASGDSLSAVGIPISGFLPVTAVLGNLAVFEVVRGSPTVRGGLALVVLGVCCTGLFFAYCGGALWLYDRSRVRPIAGRWRFVAGGGYAFLTVLLCSIPFVIPGRGSVVGLSRDIVRVAVAVPVFPPEVATAGLVSTIWGPLVVVWGCWLASLIGAVLSRLSVLWRSQQHPEIAVDGITVLTVESDRILIRPLWWFGRYVVLSSRVRDALTEERLAAVVAHESYHFRPTERALGILATLAGFLPGGRNAILAFTDLTRRERQADAYAATAVGVTPLVGALRQLERLRERERPAPTRSLRWLLVAPYRLFYGRVLVDRAHDSVDARITRLIDDDSERG